MNGSPYRRWLQLVTEVADPSCDPGFTRSLVATFEQGSSSDISRFEDNKRIQEVKPSRAREEMCSLVGSSRYPCGGTACSQAIVFGN